MSDSPKNSYSANLYFSGASAYLHAPDPITLQRMVAAVEGAMLPAPASRPMPALVNAPPPTDAYQTDPAPSSQAPADPKPAPTYDDMRDVVLIRLGAKSRDAVVALLAKFGATKLSELRDQPAIFPDVIIEAERVLKELA